MYLNFLYFSDIEDCHVALADFVDSHRLVSYGLSESGIKACKRVLAVIAYSFPAITYCPLLYPLTAIFMHYMDGMILRFFFSKKVSFLGDQIGTLK